MYHNGYSVRIVGGKEKENGYVALSHDQQYQLCLKNAKDHPCDAEVRIDGKHVGTWRIEAHRSLTLERPAHDHGKFTFYEVDTPEGRAAQLSKANPNLGLVSVTFKPGTVVTARPLTVMSPTTWHWYYPVTQTNATHYTRDTSNDTWILVNCPDSGINYCSVDSVPLAAPDTLKRLAAGGTGVSGYSNQTFHEVTELNYDLDATVTINLRLVSDKDHIRPLTPSATPVPPPVG